MSTTTPPIPVDPWEQRRWDHTRLRRRLISGEWRADLQRRVIQAVGPTRAEAWGVGSGLAYAGGGTAYGGVDLSSNILMQVSGQLACMYDRPPSVAHPDEISGEVMAATLERAGWASLMQRIQRDTLALREMMIRVDVALDSAADLRVSLRPVYPDLVVGAATPARPDELASVREARLRADPLTGEHRWTWDALDVRDPAHPSYRVIDAVTGDDVTLVYLGADLSGAAYPYRDSDGRPVLPYVLWHASRCPGLWDAWAGVELVEGTLQAGVHWSHLAHAMTQAAHPQRYAVGVELPNSHVTDGEGRARHEVVADPATVLMLQPSPDAPGGMTIGQWQPGADIGAMTDAVERYERRVAAFAGVSASDLLRVSGDPRSGYALMISREGKREASKRFEPVFRRSDEQLCRVIAVLVNRLSGTRLAEGGYRIGYQPVPLSADERKAEVDETLELLDRGMLTRVEAMMRVHGITRSAAEGRLAVTSLEGYHGRAGEAAG